MRILELFHLCTPPVSPTAKDGKESPSNPISRFPMPERSDLLDSGKNSPPSPPRTWSEAADKLLQKIKRTRSLRTLSRDVQHDAIVQRSATIDVTNSEYNSFKMRPSSSGNVRGSVSRKILSLIRKMSTSKPKGLPPSFSARLRDKDDFEREISTAFDSSGLDELSFPGRSSSTLWREIASMGKYFDINVYDNHGCSKVIRIDELTTAAEVCTRFDRYIDLCTSQLYEEVADLPGLVHPIEDHQVVLDIISNWHQDPNGFRLSVRENLGKYSPFSESAGSYNQLRDVSSILELFDYGERRTATGRLSAMSMPNPSTVGKALPPYVTSGLLWFHPSRRPWKKYFCFLHGEAVFFSPTHHSIVSRDMRLLVDLGTIDVFHAKPQSSPPFRTPTPYVIVCRPTTSHILNGKILATFATRTSAGQKAWENGMRIHKFGYSRLEANYREAMKTAKNPPLLISQPSSYDPTHFDSSYVDENILEDSTPF